MDLKADQIAGTEDCLTAKIAHNFSAGVTNQEVAAQTSVLEEEKSYSQDQAENLDDECQNQSCKVLAANVAEGHNHVNFDSEPEPAAEMESGEVKSLVTVEESAKCKGLILSFSGGQSDTINLESSGLNGAENDYDGNFDFEAESITEEESDDGDSSEGQSSDNQSEDDDSEGESSEDDSSEEELSGDEVTDCDENGAELKRDIASSVFEAETLSTELELLSGSNTYGFVDVDVVQEDDISAGFQPSLDEMPKLTKQVPSQDENPMMQKSSNSGPLVDVYVSAKMSLSTCQSMAFGGKLASEFAFSPNQPSGQFPRPTLSTSRKSPILVIRDDTLDDENKEDGIEMGSQMVKEDEVRKNEDASLEGISLRQLQKMLKAKLQIANNKDNSKDQNVAKVRPNEILFFFFSLPSVWLIRVSNIFLLLYLTVVFCLNGLEQKVEKTRIALQTLPENRIAMDEHVNNAI